MVRTSNKAYACLVVRKGGRNDGRKDIPKRQIYLQRAWRLQMLPAVGSYFSFNQLREMIKVCRYAGQKEKESAGQSLSKKWFKRHLLRNVEIYPSKFFGFESYSDTIKPIKDELSEVVNMTQLSGFYKLGCIDAHDMIYIYTYTYIYIYIYMIYCITMPMVLLCC